MSDESIEDWRGWRDALGAAIKGEDDAVMRRCYDELFPDVYRYVLCRVNGDHNAAEEIVEETFFCAFRDLEKFDASHAPIVWFRGIARFRVLDHYRKQNRKPVLELAFSKFDEEFSKRLFEIETRDLPDDELEKGELSTLVELVLSQLPIGYERVLRLRYLEGQTVKDLAGFLKTTPKAAEAKLFRARNAFRDAFRIAASNSSICV